MANKNTSKVPIKNDCPWCERIEQGQFVEKLGTMVSFGEESDSADCAMIGPVRHVDDCDLTARERHDMELLVRTIQGSAYDELRAAVRDGVDWEEDVQDIHLRLLVPFHLDKA